MDTATTETETPTATSLKFSLKLKKLEIEIDEKIYTLSEITGSQRDTYLNDTSNRIRFGSKGEAQGIKNFDGIQTKLLSMCLMNPDGKLVEEKILKTWPASVLEALYTEAQKLSGLNKEQPKVEEELKKD